MLKNDEIIQFMVLKSYTMVSLGRKEREGDASVIKVISVQNLCLSITGRSNLLELFILTCKHILQSFFCFILLYEFGILASMKRRIFAFFTSYISIHVSWDGSVSELNDYAGNWYWQVWDLSPPYNIHTITGTHTAPYLMSSQVFLLRVKVVEV
jgi:hypothetical protein